MTKHSSAKNLIPFANKYDRIVVLVDMDCFYCQVEEKLNPLLKNKPVAVVQYNAWKGGGIIAVNYAARAKGVTRHMRGDEAKEQCPGIELVKVPNVRGKADLTIYREAGKEVANVLQRFTAILERSSVDEAYLDITDAVNERLQELNKGNFVLQPQELVNTYAVGFPTIGEFVTTITTSFITNPLPDGDTSFQTFNEFDIPAVRQSNIRLLIGASIASEIRSAVKKETSYECSAGIAHNKILAKLACGINKPNKQTVLPLSQIPNLFETLPIGKIKGLGGKFGEEVCECLNIRYIGQLLKFTQMELQKKFDENNGTWLYYICRGIDLEPVSPRFYSKSIGCCKKFPGRNNITGLKTLQHWLNELANEINERLEKDVCENNRRATQMVISFIQEFNGEEISSSRSAPLQNYDTEIVAKMSLEIIRTNTKHFFRSGSESVLNNPIKFLGISVGKFETMSSSQNNIQEMFAQQAAKKHKLRNETQTLSLTTTLETNEVETELDNNVEIGQSFLLKPEMADKDETKLEDEANDKHEHIFVKQIPKKTNVTEINSFFLNALKSNEFRSNANNHIDSYNTNTTFNKPGTKSESIAQKDLEISNKGDCVESIKKNSEKSFFARALQAKVKTVSTTELPNSTNKSNLNSRSENNCHDNETKILQIEENASDSEVKNGNKNYFNADNNGDFPISVSNSGTMNKKRKEDTAFDTQSANRKDYRMHYAEFAVPQLNTEILQFINCSKCGIKVSNIPVLVQTHQDFHFAQELSKQQRQEYRNEILSKISPKNSPKNVNNRKSKSLSTVGRKTSCNIKKYLNTSPSSTLAPTLTSNENQCCEVSASNIEICDICKLAIKIDEIPEHKDFHIAKDLQKELNQLEVLTVNVSQKKASGAQQRKVPAKKISMFFNPSKT